jgi:ATP-dependent Clp protease adaptor protein ClpS
MAAPPTDTAPLARSAPLETAAPLETTAPLETPGVEEVSALDRAWVTIVWNDPVNLMSYVTWVFQRLFGYNREKAEALMLDVHHRGRAIVSSGVRERMEYDATRLHGYGLWATVDQP